MNNQERPQDFGWGSMSPCHLWRRKFDYELVHSEVYLNKYVVSIYSAVLPPAFRKLLFFACFRFLIFHPFFQEGQLTPFAPTCGCP